MTNNTPIDEYFFWKNFIEDKEEANEDVPDKMYEILKHAERKLLFYLMEKHHMPGTSDGQVQVWN